jgi:sulfane dehydrogenase subunit SoxC
MEAAEGVAEAISLDELQQATRNHGMPLEALRYDLTPVGLHYLLIHYDIPFVDPDRWRLEVRGLVRNAISLSLSELRERPAVEVVSTIECAGNGRALLSRRRASQPWLLEAVGTARWRGVGLRALLDEAGLADGAVEIVFTGLDRGIEGEVEQSYQRALPLEEALRDDVLLAYEMNGQPLLPQHGFPLRLVVPGWYGMTSVKWLHEIDVVGEPFAGYQHARAYRRWQHEDDEGEPITRIQPRALMVPPGIPGFPVRERKIPLGPCLLEGRAWSGFAPIERVDVSTDGGETWAQAELEEAPSAYAWRRWTYEWRPQEPGGYTLTCRATDAAGNAQPAEPEWNLGGYENNAVQRVAVTVAAP